MILFYISEFFFQLQYFLLDSTDVAKIAVPIAVIGLCVIVVIGAILFRRRKKQSGKYTATAAVDNKAYEMREAADAWSHDCSFDKKIVYYINVF